MINHRKTIKITKNYPKNYSKIFIFLGYKNHIGPKLFFENIYSLRSFYIHKDCFEWSCCFLIVKQYGISFMETFSQKRSHQQFMMSDSQAEEGIMKITSHELGEKFKSKVDLYTYLTEILGYYMPSIEGINRGIKRLLEMDQIKMVKVHKYDELSVRQLYLQACDDQELSIYLPDISEKSKPIDKQYFFNVLNTIQPEYLSHNINKSRGSRNGGDGQGQKNDYILISDNWFSQLTSHPFISSNLPQPKLTQFWKKSGRTMQLLKAQKKLMKARKPKQLPPKVVSLK